VISGLGYGLVKTGTERSPEQYADGARIVATRGRALKDNTESRASHAGTQYSSAPNGTLTMHGVTGSRQLGLQRRTAGHQAGASEQMTDACGS